MRYLCTEDDRADQDNNPFTGMWLTDEQLDRLAWDYDGEVFHRDAVYTIWIADEPLFTFWRVEDGC